jgi:hypothetical protein
MLAPAVSRSRNGRIETADFQARLTPWPATLSGRRMPVAAALGSGGTLFGDGGP